MTDALLIIYMALAVAIVGIIVIALVVHLVAGALG